MKKATLTEIIFAGTVALSACSDPFYEAHKYSGKIDQEEILFTKEEVHVLKPSYYILSVGKKDGTIVRYFQHFNEGDIFIDKIEIIKKDGEILNYHKNNEVGDLVLKQAQKKYDAYLQKIKDTKVNEVVELIE